MKSKNYKIRSKMDDQIFTNLADDWWKEDGAFKALHSFNIIRLKFIKEKIRKGSIKNFKILDVGCGGGILCEPLARLGMSVTGIDTNKKAINIAREHAKKKNLKINYHNVDITEVRANNFDLITCMEVLEHVEDVNCIISRAKKILKKDGFFIGSTINRTFISYILAIFFAESVLKVVPKGTHEWNKLIKPNQLKKTFLKNKFSQFEVCGVTYNPLSNVWKFSDLKKVNYLFSAKSC
jgi:2-polyprenyl-6-hydroxyphenyl methylase/3-demethylubiquinone-9 3-methyltransferase